MILSRRERSRLSLLLLEAAHDALFLARCAKEESHSLPTEERKAASRIAMQKALNNGVAYYAEAMRFDSSVNMDYWESWMRQCGFTTSSSSKAADLFGRN